MQVGLPFFKFLLHWLVELVFALKSLDLQLNFSSLKRFWLATDFI